MSIRYRDEVRFITQPLACSIGCTLYFYLGPHKKVFHENQQLREKIETTQAAESKLKEEITKLKATLSETKAELVLKSKRVNGLQTQREELKATVAKLKEEREHLPTKLDQLRKAIRINGDYLFLFSLPA